MTDSYDVLVVGGIDEVDANWTRRSGDARYQDLCVDSGDCGSNSGDCIDVWAPAAHIVSAGPFGAPTTSDSYCLSSGTSMAAPHATGAVARSDA